MTEHRNDGGEYRVPRAILPTLQEMALSESDRLASLWNRNAGNAQQQFTDFESFLRRFGASEGSNYAAAESSLYA